MLRSSLASSSATRGGMATTSSSDSSRAALPRRTVLRSTSIVVFSSAVGDSRSVSSIPRALAASSCASTSGSSQGIERAARGLGSGDGRCRRIASRSRRATVTASASSPSSSSKNNGDDDEEEETEQPSTSSSSPSSSSPDDDLPTLRAKLDAAIEAEDYALAASLRDALRALEDDAAAGEHQDREQDEQEVHGAFIHPGRRGRRPG